MSKILYVSSPVQAALMREILIPELIDGFWKNHRPVGHGEVWRDVQVKVTEDGTLGPVGFAAPRNYNLLNLDFSVPNEARLVACAQSVKPTSTIKSVKKELIELGRIVGSRLASTTAEPLKLYRGNHKPGTVTVSSAKARQASAAIAAAVVAPVKVLKPVKTVKKEDHTTTTAAGATVRRVAVSPIVIGVSSIFAVGASISGSDAD